MQCRLLAAAVLAALALPGHGQPSANAGPRFDILEFVVEGDTMLGTGAIERAVYPFLGPDRTAADAEGARKALEKAYQDAGFLSVSVVLPPQRVDVGSGEVRLQVVQSTVEKLRVTGARHFLPSAVRDVLPSLAPGSVPDFNQMQQELAAVSRATPDREVTPILAAGEAPGTMSVEIKVQDQLPLHGSLELNNKQSLNTQAGRLEASVSYDNLFQRLNSIGLIWLYSPRRPQEANILTLSYNLPIGGPGDRLYAVFTHSDSNTPTALGGETVSRGDTWRLRWRDALPTLGTIGHALTWGVTFRDLRDRNNDVAGITTRPSALRYPSFSAGYDLELSSEAVPGRSSRIQAELAVSLPGLSERIVPCFDGDTSRSSQFTCKRAGASADFQVLGLTLQHREPLGRGWLSARLQTQLSASPLVPAEQVVFGGVDSVRGYYEGEQSGDLGAAMRLEGVTPPWASSAQGITVRALSFFDVAILHRLEALPTEPVTTRMASAGLGLRLQAGMGLQASLDWVRILRGTTRLDANGLLESLTPRGDKWTFALRQEF
jgi:hemolysin activation/secretion protein